MVLTMIDTHCHLTYPGLADRLDEVFAHAREREVTDMITIGTRIDDSERALELAGRCANVWASAGIHPHEAGKIGDPVQEAARLRNMLEHPRCVAIGEMGMDAYYKDPPLDRQVALLQAQLSMAAEYPSLPIIIHNRETTGQVIDQLRNFDLAPDRVIFHCFSGSAAELEMILDFGAWVGLTGIVTFKTAGELAEASDMIPADRLLVETDSPYLTPEPHRRVRPNQPGFVRDVAIFLAQRREIEINRFTAMVDDNARRAFKLPKD